MNKTVSKKKKESRNLEETLLAYKCYTYLKEELNTFHSIE